VKEDMRRSRVGRWWYEQGKRRGIEIWIEWEYG
jgi:hypothetical protein